MNCLSNPGIDPGTNQAIGVIPRVATYFMGQMLVTGPGQLSVVNIMNALLLLAVVIYGFRMATGDVQRMLPETMKVMFKIAAVYLFYNSAPAIYTALVGTMNSLSDAIASTNISAPGSFCIVPLSGAPTGSTPQGLLWGRFDCIFAHLFGYMTAGVTAGGILALAVAFFVGWPAGILLMLLALYFLFTLFFIVARFIHVYVISLLAFSFLFGLGYLVVPLVVLKSLEKDYFQKWLFLCLSYLLTPIIMFGFMQFATVAFDEMIFSAPYSLMNMLSPKYADSTVNGFEEAVDPTQNMTTNADVPLFDVNFGNMLGTVTSPVQPVNPTNNVDSGMLGTMQYMRDNNGNIMTTETYLSQPKGAGATISITKTVSDVGKLQTQAQAAGSQTAQTQGQYVLHIIEALAAICLLVFVIYSMISYIPTLAADLASQGTRSATALGRSAVAGESNVMGTIQTGIEVMTAIAAARKLAAQAAGRALAQQTREDAGRQVAEAVSRSSRPGTEG